MLKIYQRYLAIQSKSEQHDKERIDQSGVRKLGGICSTALGYTTNANPIPDQVETSRVTPLMCCIRNTYTLDVIKDTLNREGT